SNQRGSRRKEAQILSPSSKSAENQTLLTSAATINDSTFDIRTSTFPYFRSRITIHDAIASGLPINATELQAGLNDPEAWAQAYLCEFSDNSTILLAYELIASCETELATATSTVHSLSASAVPGNLGAAHLYAGIDYTRPGIGFGDYLQKELRCGPAMEHQFRNYTHKLWRLAPAANRIELCHFTPAFKAELFPRLRSALENRELLIPGSRDIREDLHS